MSRHGPLFSMTFLRDRATRYDAASAPRALEAARLAFPDYQLSVEAAGEGAFLIASEGMKVQRWLRE